MMLILLSWTITLLCCSYAACNGGREGRWERIWASLMIIANKALQYLTDSRIVDAGSDCVLLGALVTIVMRTRRFWPIWATGIQMNTVVLALASLAMPQATLLPPLIALLGLALPMIMALGIMLDRRNGLD